MGTVEQSHKAAIVRPDVSEVLLHGAPVAFLHPGIAVFYGGVSELPYSSGSTPKGSSACDD